MRMNFSGSHDLHRAMFSFQPLYSHEAQRSLILLTANRCFGGKRAEAWSTDETVERKERWN